MPRTILFLCPHNAAKSVIASALFEQAVADRALDIRAASAGTEPDAGPAPPVVALLAARGLDVSGHRPRRVDAEALSGAARVISMGCDLSGLAPPGTPVERWDEIPAPSADLASAYRLIRARVLALLEEEAANR